MSVSTFDPTGAPVIVSAAAADFFAANLRANASAKMVRLSTRESGCTGYAYVLDLVDEPNPNDVVIRVDDRVTLAVAADAVGIIRGTTIDMAHEGLNHVVKFHNPNVVAECGCGESFSVS